ncbi:MAG: M56 family metallopeptidase [Pirellulaceae bacterium]
MSRFSMDWSELSLQLMITFGHFLWQACVIGFVLFVAQHVGESLRDSQILRRRRKKRSSVSLGETDLRGANIRYTIACVAFFSLPICVIATFASVRQSRRPFLLVENTLVDSPVASANEAITTMVNTGLPVLPPSATPINAGVSVTESSEPPTLVVEPQTSPLQRIQVFAPYLLLAYIVGVGLMLARFSMSILGSSRLRRTIEPITDVKMLRTIAEQCAQVGLKRVPIVALCHRVSVPVVVGIVKPMILLPPALLCGLDPNQIAAILSHEIAHLRRYDLLVNLLQRIVEAFLFFHPVTWWISRRVSIERENCCDDMAAAGCGRMEYAAALLRMAEQCASIGGLNIAPQLESLAADGGSTSQLGYRIERLLGEDHTPRVAVTRSFVGAIGLAAVFGGLSMVAIAQSADDGPIENESANSSSDEWGEESHGLVCRIVPVDPSIDAEAVDRNAPVARFRSPDDITFVVELKNVSDQSIHLKDIRYGDAYAEETRGKLHANHYAPHLFEFTFTDGTGEAVARTQREFTLESHAMILRGAYVAKVEPSQSLKCLLTPANFERSMDYRLPPGDYRVQVSYRGPSEAARDWMAQHDTGQQLDELWAHQVTSNLADFSISAEGFRKPDLVWGPEKDGLQAALEIRVPRDSGIPTQTPGVLPEISLQPVLHVKNVSDKPISFVSETGRQGDLLQIRNAAGEDVKVQDVWYSGWPIDVRWTLQPGEVAELDVLTPSLNQGLATGEYSARYTIRFNSRQMKDQDGNQTFPAPGDYDSEIDTGWTPLFIRGPTQPPEGPTAVQPEENPTTDEANESTPALLKETFRLPEHRGVGSVAFRADSGQLTSLAWETASDQAGLRVTVRSWSLDDRKLTGEVELDWQLGWTRYVSNLLLSQDCKLVVGLLDGEICEWDAASGEIVKRYDIPDDIKNDSRYSVSLSHLTGTPDLSRIAFGRSVSLGGTMPSAHAIVMDMSSGQVIQKVKMEHRVSVQSLALSSDGARLATVGSQHGATIWDVDSGQLVLDFRNDNTNRVHPDPSVKLSSTQLVSSAGFSPDGKFFAISDMLGAKLIDTQTGKVSRTIDAPYRYYDANSQFVFSADSQLFALLGTFPEKGEPRTISIWSAESGERLRTLPIEATAAAFSADGKWFAAGKSDAKEALAIWQIRETKLKKPAANPAAQQDEHAKSDQSSWVSARPLKVTVSSGVNARILDDHSVRLEGDVHWQEASLKFAFDRLTNIKEIRLEILPVNLPTGPTFGRGGEELMLFDVKPSIEDQTGKFTSLDLASCTYLQNPADDTTANCIDYLSDTGWKVPKLSADASAHELVLRFEKPIALQPDQRLTLAVDSGGAEDLAVLNCIRFAFRPGTVAGTRSVDSTASGGDEKVEPWEISKLYEADFLRNYLQDNEALPKPIVVPAVRGKVFDPDGKPASGVSIVSHTPRHWVELDATLSVKPHNTGGVKNSKQDGTFGLPERKEPYRVLFVHESGVANISHEELLRANGIVALQKWASVTGTVNRDGKPQAGETIILDFDTLPWSFSRGGPRLTTTRRTTTDKDGNFSFDRVPPLGGVAMSLRGPKAVYECKSGKNTYLEIGAGNTETHTQSASHDHHHDDVNQAVQPDGKPQLPRLIVKTVDSDGKPVPDTGVLFYDRNSQRAGQEQKFEMISERTNESGVADFGVMPNSFGCLQLSSNQEFAACYTLISASMTKCTQGKPLRANVQTEIKDGILTVTFTMTPHVDLEFNIVDDATNEIVFWSEIFYQDPTTNRWWQFGLVDGSQSQHNFIPISPQITRETIRISALGYETKVFRLPDELDRSQSIRRDIRLKPMPDVQLQVVLPDGTPAEKARLTFQYPNELDCLQDQELRSDTQGTVTTRFPPNADIGMLRLEHTGGIAELSMQELLDAVKQNPGEVVQRSIQLIKSENQ